MTLSSLQGESQANVFHLLVEIGLLPLYKHGFLKLRPHACVARQEQHLSHDGCTVETTGSPSSKYEHRRASALLRNIQNIRICVGKKPREKTVYIKTHKTAINRPVDHTGET